MQPRHIGWKFHDFVAEAEILTEHEAGALKFVAAGHRASKVKRAHPGAAPDSSGMVGAPISDPARFDSISIHAGSETGAPGAVRGCAPVKPHWIFMLALALLLSSLRAGAAPPASPADAFGSEYLLKTWRTDEGLPSGSITCITQTRDGYLWFGTFNGLARLDGVRFTAFDPDNAPGLASATIYGFYADRAGRLWIAQDNGKLSFWERGRFTEVLLPSFPGRGRNKSFVSR